MADFTDAQLRALAVDVLQATNAETTAAANLAAARKALAQALGPGGQCVISGRLITANASGTDVAVSAVRVVT